MKRLMIINGHDFRIARLLDGGTPPKRNQRKGVKEGVICFNCGVYSVARAWRQHLAVPVKAFGIVQCCQAQGNLFGPDIFLRQEFPPPRYWGTLPEKRSHRS